jgi:hypothetical protein
VKKPAAQPSSVTEAAGEPSRTSEGARLRSFFIKCAVDAGLIAGWSFASTTVSKKKLQF